MRVGVKVKKLVSSFFVRSSRHIFSPSLIMLDHCSISHKGQTIHSISLLQYSILISGGIVLWSRSFTPEASHIASSAASPVNSLIREALIESKNAAEKYEKDGYAVKWTFVNDLELIFVVCHRMIKVSNSYSLYFLGCVSTNPPTNIRGRAASSLKDPLCQTIRTIPLYVRCISACWYCRQSISRRNCHYMEFRICLRRLGQVF